MTVISNMKGKMLPENVSNKMYTALGAFDVIFTIIVTLYTLFLLPKVKDGDDNDDGHKKTAF